ncbi:cell division-specific peptidoglycan biosynthesis regulator FtsW [Thermolongibacillus altinsuensis]|uniref:Probable peptidoglycan glycosyltransferase FtsW n=1 Tax=Thermolongibacillus altinsuensis TaxID=575256 RepID=A0A4V2QAB2_9BACL|nr:FtsW/RodA/SpoVE family cell cycle protein [Thermolongibacillus altinsuensis]TCL50237.1 cell division-specific peptidoglycan biosynthesis regulator FtsW [Thermolongibacillus altinsuensis]
MDKQLFKKIIKSYDYPLIIAVFLLSLFGLIMVYSASMITAVVRYHTASDYFFQKQKWALILGTIAFLVTAFVPYKIYATKKVLQFIFFALPISLILVILIGYTANNATSWFKIGSFGIQPAEFAKLGLIVYLSGVFANKQKKLHHSAKDALFPIYYMLFICILIAAQPDFGTAFIIFVIASTIIVCSAISKKLLFKQILFLLFLCLLASPFVLSVWWDEIFSEERLSRIDGFLHPFEHAEDEGFQLINSYFAIANGGLKGLGLGQSIQKYGYLPEAHTDFIMAVIAEELGLFGVMFVLLLLSFIVLRGLLLARKCQDAFGSLLAIGISTMIAIQSFVNLGGLTGLIPITGVTLPFVSYGGSSLVLLMLSVGVLANISMFAKYELTYKRPSARKNFQKNHVSFH